MENNGWIKLHRIIMDHPDWLSEPFTKAQAWVDLLLLANHKVGHIWKRGILIEVQRGQVGYSEETLAARWKWSREKVRRFLGVLGRDERISRKPVQQNPKLSCLISIVNYDAYQGGDTSNDTTEKHQTIQEQECKKVKNKYMSESDHSDFGLFYKSYPKHESKKKAFDAWRKLHPDNDLQQIILSAIKKQKIHKAGLKSRNEFCPEWPLPSTWLNGNRWEDEITEEAPARKITPSLICPRCGRDLVVKNDLYGAGCIHCQRALEARV